MQFQYDKGKICVISAVYEKNKTELASKKRSPRGLLFITLFFVADSLDSSTCPKYQQYVLSQTILRSSRQS